MTPLKRKRGTYQTHAIVPHGSSDALQKQVWRVLVVPGGTEIGLEINKALRECKEIELFSAGQDVPSAAEFCFRNHFAMPSVRIEGWIEALSAIIDTHKIDFVYPAHDDVVVALAGAEAHLNARVLGSSHQTCEIARSKSATYKLLSNHVPTPRVFQAGSIPSFPVFVKPDRGQGSQRARRIDDIATLNSAIEQEPDLLISEYLTGEEYTVDCFSSQKSGLIFARARSRIRTRAGISMQSRLVNNPIFFDLAKRIASAMDFRGAWFFQVKYDTSGTLRLLEVAPRIAGTMALNRVTGLNFPLMTLYDAAGYDVQALTFDADIEISRSLENHYRVDFTYSAVYIDLDDTLIIRDKLNTNLVKFIYQCINYGRPVHLLTRHNRSLTDTLDKFRIRQLFDHVHHVTGDVCKSEFIQEADAIFIDDSFSERSRVARKLRIKTFDASGIECLIDDRA